MKKDVLKLSPKAFTHMFDEAVQCNRRFCFILGSGASSEAGIQTGMEMAKSWASELDNKYEKKELEELMKQLGINSIEPNSKNYFGIYDLRFYPYYQEGYAYFERELEKGSPSLGHYALAKILAGKIHNLAITTNFDSLIEDALFIYTNKHPLLVGHESLTEFINLNIDRPIVAKIHRSLYFHPFNRQQDTDGLAAGWRDTLKNALMVYTPIVIGYAGGDRSLMKFLRDDNIKMNGLYWCYWNKEEPSDEILDLVRSKNGCLVPIEGFDQIMFMLSRKLGFENPEVEMEKVTQMRIQRYNTQYEKFETRIREELREPTVSDIIEQTLEEINSFNNLQLKLAQREQSDESYFQRGCIYGRMQRHMLAIENYTKAIELGPGNARYYLRRGNSYHSLRKYEKAAADYTKALELKPGDGEIYFHRANSYRSMEEYEIAIVDYTAAIALDPDDPNLYYYRGCSYGRIGDCEKAIADYTKTIELKSNYAEAYINRGNSYDSMQMYETAIKDYTRAAELKPDYVKVYHNRGRSYDSIEEYDMAVEDYTKAIELQPDYAQAYINRGCTYHKIGELEKAIADDTKAIEIQGDYAEAYYNRGISYEKQQEYEKAAADYTSAIELMPEDAEAFLNRGNCYDSMQEYEMAIADYTRAAELRPEKAEAYHRRGCCYYSIQEYEKAIGDYSRALELQPDDARAYNNRACSYYCRMEYAKAITDCTRAIELCPDYADAYYNRGTSFSRLQKYEHASEDYTKALELQPDDAQARRHREEAQKALSGLNKAIQLSSDYKGGALVFKSRAKQERERYLSAQR